MAIGKVVTDWVESLVPDLTPRRALLFVILSLVLLVGAGVLTEVMVNYSNRTSDWVAHTLEVRSKAVNLLEEVNELEPSWLGNLYLISKPVQPLDPKARLRAFRDLQGLGSLVVDNPEQERRVEHMRTLIETEMARLDQAVNQAQPLGDGFVVDTSSARKSMASFRALVSEFNEVEDKLLVERELAAQQARSVTLALVLACLLSAAATVVGVLAMSSAYIRNLNKEAQLRNEAELKAARSQRMEAVGQLAGGVAHDFNNLLTVIVASLDVLKRRLARFSQEDTTSLEKPIDSAIGAAMRGATLTNQLLAYSHQQVLMPKSVNINAIISDLSDMLSRVVGEQIQIETHLANDLGNSFIDASQLENAILNLVLNARDAMPNGGRIIIETQSATLDEAYSAQFDDLTAGEYVVLSICDTGMGMTEEVKNKAFEPFFSTKGPTRGSGLGLAMVQGFIQQSRGHVSIYSELGRGTTVKMYLPGVSRGELDATSATAKDIKLEDDVLRARPGEVVLMVEDDEAVANSSRAILEELGFQVVAAASAPDALQTLRSGNRVDLLFTDMVLPGDINGAQLATQAHSIRPNLPVLFTTGYARNAVIHHSRLDREVRLLTKPYSPHDLAVAVHASLERS